MKKLKINRKKLKRGWQIYNAIMTNFWLLITFCLAGLIVGYFVDKANPTDNNFWLLFFSIIGFTLGIFNFFIRLIYDLLKLNKTETKEIQEMVEENPDVFVKYEEEENKEQLEKDRLELIEKETESNED